jgi:hypothetical protein
MHQQPVSPAPQVKSSPHEAQRIGWRKAGMKNPASRRKAIVTRFPGSPPSPFIRLCDGLSNAVFGLNGKGQIWTDKIDPMNPSVSAQCEDKFYFCHKKPLLNRRSPDVGN